MRRNGTNTNTNTNTNTSTRYNNTNTNSGPPIYNKQCPQFPARKCYMALDCEMVGVGPLYTTNHRSSLARIVITDWKGDQIIDQYVKQSEAVTDYRTFVSGITENNLKHATMTLDICRTIVSNILFGHILVGHGLENDLKVLGIDHPWWMIRDTAFYEPFMNVRYYDNTLLPRKLKDLVLEKLGKRIQVSGHPHSPYEDAKWAMNLYKSVRSDWEERVQYKIQRSMIESSIGRLHSARPPHHQQHQQPIHHHAHTQQAIVQSN
jgi:RNA exonuclease 4